MTKEEMVAILAGEKKPEEAKKIDEKAPFSHKCCHVSEEQAKRLKELAFLDDEQESCRKLSHFIGENISDDRIKAVLQGCVVCIGRTLLPFSLAILKECIAFSKDGFLTYRLTIEPHGVGIGIDKGDKLELTPWPDGVFKDGYLGLTVRLRKEALKKRVENKFDMFIPRPDDEIADLILKGVAEVTA